MSLSFCIFKELTSKTWNHSSDLVQSIFQWILLERLLPNISSFSSPLVHMKTENRTYLGLKKKSSGVNDSYFFSHFTHFSAFQSWRQMISPTHTLTHLKHTLALVCDVIFRLKALLKHCILQVPVPNFLIVWTAFCKASSQKANFPFSLET